MPPKGGEGKRDVHHAHPATAAEGKAERGHGWPEGYGWNEHLEGHIAMAQAHELTRILEEEIAPLEDPEERVRALRAWTYLRAPKDMIVAARARNLLAAATGASESSQT